jgi:putative inorganic carbon (HCO3(-)) transporter
MPSQPAMNQSGKSRTASAFALCSGLFLAVSLLKFGNPAILEHAVQMAQLGGQPPPANVGLAEILIGRNTKGPADIYELLFQAWPIHWGYWMIGALACLGVCAARWRLPKPAWLAATPLIWLVWLFVSAVDTIDPVLTRLTMVHLTAVVLCYCLGLFVLSKVETIRLFWTPILLGFLLMIYIGFEQHFGGLEATRRFIYSQPGWENLSPEYLKRLASNRIFATMIYPNALAGALLLLLPAMTIAAWQIAHFLTKPTRLVLAGLVLIVGLACLFWSGSKAGWLFALVQGVVLLLGTRLQKRWKIMVVAAVVFVGLIVFAFRFSEYFQKGAPSASARIEYWRVAVRVFLDHPITGTGPGTFKTNYQRLKPREAEMARLTHNDYLQQACDSGLPGAMAYAVFIWGTLHRCRRISLSDKMSHAVWLGLLGWSLQGLTEFGLYVPASSWTAFFLFGWLMGKSESTE